MKRVKKSIVRRYGLLSLGFGIAMGLIFPVYAGFFVVFKTPLLETFFIFGCILAGLMVGGFSYFIGKTTLIKPIQRIAGNIGDITSGNTQLTSRISITSNDAIGLLADNFNLLLDQIRQMLTNLAKVSEETSASGSSLQILQDHFEETVFAVQEEMTIIGNKTKELEQSVQTLSGLRNNLSTSVGKIHRSVEGQSLELKDLPESAAGVETEINRLTETINTQFQTIQVLMTSAAQSENEIESLYDSINSVLSRTGIILEQTEIIDQVVEETDMLAMNAAIQAAHAGNEGKGFAVVAEEIRSLAVESMSNSKEIHTTLDETMKNIKTTMSSSALTRKNLELVLKQIISFSSEMSKTVSVLETTSDKSKKMLTRLNNLIQVTDDVNQSSSLLTGSVDEIHKSMDFVKELTRETFEAFRSVSNSVQNMQKDMEQLRKTSSDYYRLTLTMREEINRFQTR